jgi:predicted nucleotidyltransferase
MTATTPARTGEATRIARIVPRGLWKLHQNVLRRAQDAGATGLVLTGSTVRGARTENSDLDYHLIGPPIDVADLSLELDLHVLSEKKLVHDVLAGDDFIHWSLRFGVVVFDEGPVARARLLLTGRRPWPDVTRKREHAARSVVLARKFVATGDEDGALEQVRTALSLASRARLLGEGVFPLARAELPAQLEAIGCATAARALAAAIHTAPSLDNLALMVEEGEGLLAHPLNAASPPDTAPARHRAPAPTAARTP